MLVAPNSRSHILSDPIRYKLGFITTDVVNSSPSYLVRPRTKVIPARGRCFLDFSSSSDFILDKFQRHKLRIYIYDQPEDCER